MKILIDIGHPAHVHYFKNMVKALEIKGFSFHFTLRERDSTVALMDKYSFSYTKRGKGGKNIITKLLAMPIMDFKVLMAALKFKPDMFVSFASPYAAQVACLLRKPHITFDDTEHAVFAHKLYRPFSSVVLSPQSYFKPIEKKQILFDSFMELCYLHPKYFTPGESVISELGLIKDEKYCILRFVSWDANHDVGQKGLDFSSKIKLVKELSKHCKVFISSESALPKDLEEYRYRLHPSRLHDALSFASLYIGEGATMASEAAMLGTPSIYVNTLDAGTIQDQINYGLLFMFKNSIGVIEKAVEILNMSNPEEHFKKKRDIMLSKKIDPTAFMVWFIENYPRSERIMRENPEYQYNFK
jgi:hypothetical protein